MDESERMQRMKQNRHLPLEEIDEIDEVFSDRIGALLNNQKIDKYCMVDAYYYDYSVIPDEIRKDVDLCRDCYFIFGITIQGVIVSRWVNRWDLDCDDPIVDGNVIHGDKPRDDRCVPSIVQPFNKMLLSNPCPNFFKTLIE